jgi:glycerol uptake facilitator protein
LTESTWLRLANGSIFLPALRAGETLEGRLKNLSHRQSAAFMSKRGPNSTGVIATMINYTAEALGTAMLILLGDGVVANVLLARSKGEGSGWIVITFGWGVAVMVAVYAVGRLSGAHLNPAVTMALASIGAFQWADVPGYVAAQMIGAVVGAVLVWLIYLPHWPVTQDANLKLAVFCTGPAIRKPAANLLTETIATAAFVFAVLAIAANAQALAQPGDIDLSVVFSSGLQPLLVGGLVLGVGLSLGGPTGYAINPARDLGPRFAHFLLPIPGKRDSDWGYAWIPILGPLVGGVIGAQLFTGVGF